MTGKTKIEWTDKTDNPIHLTKADGSHGGHWCRKLSAGCSKCYAETIYINPGYFRFASGLKYSGKPPENLQFDTDAVEKWKTAKKPWKRFVCSMTDLFGDWVPYEWQRKVFDEAALAPSQTIQLLTKRPDLAALTTTKWLVDNGVTKMPENIWMGVTIEDQQEATNRLPFVNDISHLFHITWVSYEPALTDVDWTPYDFLDWMVIGGESGSEAREFKLAWAKKALEFCDRNDIPAFMKQMGTNPIGQNGQPKFMGRKGKDMELWPAWAQKREFPYAN